MRLRAARTVAALLSTSRCVECNSDQDCLVAGGVYGRSANLRAVSSRRLRRRQWRRPLLVDGAALCRVRERRGLQQHRPATTLLLIQP